MDWLSYQNLQFDKVRDLRNQLNKNNPVWTGRDGQEIDPESGRDLLLSFNIIKDISEIRLKNIISISKQLKTDYLNKLVVCLLNSVFIVFLGLTTSEK